MSVSLVSHPSYTWRSIWGAWRLLELVVADLINIESATWKLEALRKLFDEEQVSRIMTIPSAGVELGYERVWRGDNIGVYSEIKERAQRFEELTFRFEGRSVNQVEHAMAEEGKQWSFLRVWIDEVSLR
ncbi:hypothetical protein Gorai_003144, partial [Gossypium raimondii]|nr:hypothetical protein [Gossypium raimondii]